METARITATRYHDIDCGHRVVGHEGRCRHLHGHTYRIHFTCEAEVLDPIGRVIDFSVIKERLCQWLEDTWDHRFLAWTKDDLMRSLARGTSYLALESRSDVEDLLNSIVFVPFNPTAENIAFHLLTSVGPERLRDTNVRLISVRVDETRKCSATASKA